MSSNQNSVFAYRPDIDGLRAIAVLAVLFFHLGFAPLAGGFLGVDIFFVISGYLITSIIAPRMANGTFSFKEFYLKRIRRLLPPAFVTISVTFIVSAFFLDPNDLIAMAKSAIAAIFSVSNIFFFTEAGYWDAQSELKPLLHTWSLGVEEQFYLFWPLIVLVLWKILRGKNKTSLPPFRLFLTFGVLTVLGVVLSEWILRLNAPAAFFLLPARMFEFSMGATVAFFGQSWLWQRYAGRVVRFGAAGLGLLILAFAIWVYRGHPPFPGVNGFLPCAATGLILLSGAQTEASPQSVPVFGFLLGNPAMRWIGQISYSLYLVHWPVVALLRYEFGLTLSLKLQIFAAVLTALLALLLYYGVERRLSARTGQGELTSKTPNNKRLVGAVLISALASSTVFAQSALTSGWTWRYDSLSLSPGQIEVGKVKRFSNRKGSCFLMNFPDEGFCDSDASLNILVFGNSHEPDGYTFLQSALGDRSDVQLVRFNQTNRCDFQIEKGQLLIKGRRPDCKARAEKIESPEIMRQFDLVFYAANHPFAENKSAIPFMLKQMKAANPDLKIMARGNYLNTKLDCPRLFNETGTLESCAETQNVNGSPDSDDAAPLRTQFVDLIDLYVDMGALLCSGSVPETCETQTPTGEPFSFDRHHLSYDFAAYAGQKFAEENPDFLTGLLGETAK